MQAISLGPVAISPGIEDGCLTGLNDIRVHDVPLRNPRNRFLPWFDTYEGDVFRKFRLRDVGIQEERTVLRTTAISDPDVLFQERRDCSGDVCLRTRSWDTEPLETELDIVLEPAAAEFDGHHFHGFTYQFVFRGGETAIHRLADRQTWEVGGDLTDVNVVCRGLFELPRKRVTVDNGYSSVGLENWSGLLPGALWARWSLMPAFDMQYGAAGTMLGWFDHVSCIRTVVESMPGEDWVRYIDLHYVTRATEVATNPKTVLFCPDVLDHTDALNLWTRVYDQEQAKACEQFGIPDEEPPAICNSINVWRGFHFDTTYEDAIETAAELGMDTVFIDPVWQNLETYQRTLEDKVGKDELETSVLGKVSSGNMCCTLDFEVSEAAGGEEALKRLCDRARAKGIRILSWMSCHYTPRTVIGRDIEKELGHGAGGVYACKESGRHPDTGYTGECWTLNLNAPIYEKIRQQILGICERTGLAGYLWDSFSNLGWWQVDYSDGTMTPQFDKMGELYADMVKAGLYVMPEAVVSFSNHSCCGLHGGNIYAGDLLGYSYNSVIGLRQRDPETREWSDSGAEAVIVGAKPIDELFQCFAHRRVPNVGLFQVPREDWDPAGVAALKELFAAYRATRELMQRRTVLKEDLGVRWDNDAGTPILWSFRPQAVETPATEVVSGATTTELEPGKVYRLG